MLRLSILLGDASGSESESESKSQSGMDKSNAERKLLNLRKNIREVMDENQLDEATLAAQRQEMERLQRVQEQQRIIREVTTILIFTELATLN